MAIIIQRTDTRKGRGGYRLDADPRECLLWPGNRNKGGYGRLWVHYADGSVKQKYAHRIAWEAVFGPIPEGWQVDHLCGQPACYRLSHIEAVPPGENQRRSNERVTHCPRGHEYTEENTYRPKLTPGARLCRTCHRDRERERRRR